MGLLLAANGLQMDQYYLKFVWNCMGRNGLLFVCTEMLYGTEICMDYMGQLWLTNSYMYVLFGIIG